MMAKISEMLSLFVANAKEYMLEGLIIVSAIIVFLGIIKPAVFDKITIKPLRKSLLAFSGIGSSFLSTAITFAAKKISFDNYLYGAVIISICTILTYWFYENTCLRDLIHKIGRLAIFKVAKLAARMFDGAEREELEKELQQASQELKSVASAGIKDAIKSDRELKNL